MGNWGRAKGTAAKSSFISLVQNAFAIYTMPKKTRIRGCCKSSGMKINRLDFVSAHHGIPLIVTSLSVERNERTRLNPGSHVSFLFV